MRRGTSLPPEVLKEFSKAIQILPCPAMQNAR
jgi:hypothetical protein